MSSAAVGGLNYATILIAVLPSMVKMYAVTEGQEPGYFRVISQQREVFVTQAGDLCQGISFLKPLSIHTPLTLVNSFSLLTDFASLACRVDVGRIGRVCSRQSLR